MPANSTPSPTARPVCSPIRRSSSAGTSRGRIRAGRGNTSSGSSSIRRDVCKAPARPTTRTVPGEGRPHRSGRITHWALARPARGKVCVRGLAPTRTTRAASWSSRVTSSSGCAARTVAVIVTSSPSKQRELDTVISMSSSAGRRRGSRASVPRAGAARRTSPAWPVSTAATRASSAAVARLRARAEGRQFIGGCAGRARWPGPRPPRPVR
jgi:hypothetical protein